MHSMLSHPPSPWAAPSAELPTSALDETSRVTVLRLRPRRAWLPRPAEASPGCGWFESSRDLCQGLDVRECPAELLDEWLPNLAPWPAASGAAAQRGADGAGAW